MERRQNRPHLQHSNTHPHPHAHNPAVEKKAEPHLLEIIAKATFYVVGMSFIAPYVLNRVAKAIDSDIRYGFDFYKIAKGE